MEHWLFELRPQQRSCDKLTRVRILTAQADTQGAGHRTFRLSRIRAFVFRSVALPGLPRGLRVRLIL